MLVCAPRVPLSMSSSFLCQPKLLLGQRVFREISTQDSGIPALTHGRTCSVPVTLPYESPLSHSAIKLESRAHLAERFLCVLTAQVIIIHTEQGGRHGFVSQLQIPGYKNTM